MDINILTPPLAWPILFVAAYLIFQWAGSVMAKGKDNETSKCDTYACGEAELKGRPFDGIGSEYEVFFASALFFTVTEVAVLLMITLPLKGSMPPMAYGLLIVIMLCSAGLLNEIRGARR
jgi:NADH:ubiquinone oxidoreductase subunit 3 (subunit A)